MTTSRCPPRPNLIVVGASVRAFGCSAQRVGWSVHAADLFGDADLRAIATTTVAATEIVGPYPASLVAAVEGFPRAPWCYTGALENHPQVIATLAAARPLLGASPDAARSVRDHHRLADVVRSVGIGFPKTFSDPSKAPRDGTYLVKPLASAGGRGIARWNPAAGHGAVDAHVWQQWINGESWAAAFVIDRLGRPRLWGTSRQLVGLEWCHARPFAYCGSVDVSLPTLAPPLRHQLDRLGQALADAFGTDGLVGLIGVDLVVDPAGRLHVIGINPRPTASMELVERATGESLAAVHLTACGGEPPPTADARPTTTVWGKAVLFAPLDLRIDTAHVAAMQSACLPALDAERDWPSLADIPCPGTSISSGAPLITIFAAGDAHAVVLDRLRRRAAAIDAVVSACQPAGH